MSKLDIRILKQSVIDFLTRPATETESGWMSAADKKKLNGVAEKANNYSLPKATNTTLGGVRTGSNITNSDGTISLTKENIVTALGYTPPAQDTDTRYSEATTSAAGLMSASDKSKLSGIATGANNYSHPSYTARTGKPASNQTPEFGGSVTISQVSSDASGHVTGMTDRTIKIPDTAMTGATTGAAGGTGLVPAPAKGEANRYLRSDGSWQVPPNDNTTYSAATQSTAGLMSADDKKKLDGVATGANAYSHPAYTAKTGKPAGNQAPGFGGTFTLSQITSDAAGHVTAATDRTVTIPDTAATSSAAGLMSADDKKKLDGVASGANAYTHPTTAGNKHIPAGGSSGRILEWSAAGTAAWSSNLTLLQDKTQDFFDIANQLQEQTDYLATAVLTKIVDDALESGNS